MISPGFVTGIVISLSGLIKIESVLAQAHHIIEHEAQFLVESRTDEFVNIKGIGEDVPVPVAPILIAPKAGIPYIPCP